MIVAVVVVVVAIIVVEHRFGLFETDSATPEFLLVWLNPNEAERALRLGAHCP